MYPLQFKLRVSKYGIFFTFFAFLAFLPGYFSNSIHGILNNIFAVLAATILFTKKYRPSPFIILSSAYYIYLILVTYLRSEGGVDISFIISNVRNIIMLGLIEYMFQQNSSKSRNILLRVFLVYILLDFASLLLFPEGLYFTEKAWNEWSTTEVANWFLGNKNNRIIWYLLTLLMAYWKHNDEKKPKSKGLLIFIMCVAFGAIAFCASSTSFVVIIIALLGIINSFRKRTPCSSHINIFVIYSIYAVSLALTLSGSVGFLNGFISNVLGKDMTFTGRTIIWAKVGMLILKKPILGWGYISGVTAADLLGNLSFTSAHNVWLNTLWQGGICLLIIVLSVFWLIAKKLRREEREIETTVGVILFAAMINMMFESILSVSVTWVFLLICYEIGIHSYENKNEKKV